MDPIGPTIASSLAGLNQAERQNSRDAKRTEAEAARAKFRRALDEAELTVAQTESDGAVRGVASNEEEEARQDHREHKAYGAKGADDDADKPADTPRLDLNA